MFSAPPPNFPGGYTYVFQGTVQEDATGGTHVCTLTVTPGAGNEMQVLYGFVTVGNTATAQTFVMDITDGTNLVFEGQDNNASTTASLRRAISGLSFTVQAGTSTGGAPAQGLPIISGNMQLVLKVTTAAVSVTQTFALVCRMKNPVKPTTTLADTVGTPTLTKNTDALFTS